ncbi:hypothetical protein ACWDR1_15785 [Streptosporangium sandarakinum]
MAATDRTTVVSGRTRAVALCSARPSGEDGNGPAVTAWRRSAMVRSATAPGESS